MRRPLAGVAVALTAMALVPSRVEAAPRPFRFNGEGCVAAEAAFVTTVAKAKPFVPAPYVVFDLAGYAVGALRVTRCERIFVDGGLTAPGTFASVLIDIQPPRGAPGASAHAYELWVLSGRSDLQDRYREMGMAGAFSSATTLETLAPAPLYAARASAGWSRGGFNVSVAAPDPTTGIPVRGDNSAWHRGANGTFRTVFAVKTTEHAGPALVTPTGEIADLLGLPAMPLPGFVRTLSFSATVASQPVSS